MKKNLWIPVVTLFLFSCNEKKELSQEMLCTELHTANHQEGDFSTKATSLNKNLWPHSINFPINITVRFLNGTEFQKNKVREYAKIWNDVSASGMGASQRKHKINFRFIPYDVTTSGNIADIRVLFQDGGSSSYVGIDCRNIPQDQPTMFFGWINPRQSHEVIRQVVLHEFGHALGLVHEHQSPLANIPWDKEKVYEYYKTTQNPPWDKAKVDANIFSRYSTTSTNYTAYDPKSIMHYAIPGSLTIGGYSTPWNSSLSSLDTFFIRQIYKYRPCVVGETCCFDKNGKPVPCN